MIRIGIELNGVVRNINKQILKYYQKDIDPSLDLDETDEKDDPFKYAKFESNAAKNEFIYIDYPYELFACSKAMDTELPSIINNWLSELTNYEEDEVEVMFFSLNEEYLTIQSTYFFLSKIGTRVRKVVFPRNFSEIENDLDVVITANKKLFDEYLDDNDKLYSILISNKVNTECEEKANVVYPSLMEALKDEHFLDDIQKFINNKVNEKNTNNGKES